jgi:hypothetical protein
MAEPQITRSKIADFAGMNSAADPHDLKAGQSVLQINCGGVIPGKLRTRPGLKFVDFSGGNGGTSNAVQVAHPFKSPFGNFIVYQRANGDIIAGKDPS